MGHWDNLFGTSETSFRFGKGGPILKNVLGNFEVRNSADTDLVSLFSKVDTRSIIHYDPGHATTLGVLVGSTPTSAGTVSHVGPSIADPVRRTLWQTAAGAGSAAGYRVNHNAWARQLGFEYWQRITWINATQLQVQAGLLPTAALAAEPSATLNQIILGMDSTDANLQLMTNDGAGASQKTDLGIARGSPIVLDLFITAVVGASTVNIRVERPDTSAVLLNVNPSTKIPGPTTFIAPCIQCRNVPGAGGQGSIGLAMFEGKTRF